MNNDYACFNCDSAGGGYYKQHVGETTWHMGLDAHGQAHYACTECSVLLYNVAPVAVPSDIRDSFK